MEAVAVDASRGVAVGRHGVGVAGEDQPLRPAEGGAGDEVVADPGDLAGATRARSSASSSSTSGPSSRLGDATATSSAVRASRSTGASGAGVMRSGGGAVQAQHVVERGLVVALALGQCA